MDRFVLRRAAKRHCAAGSHGDFTGLRLTNRPQPPLSLFDIPLHVIAAHFPQRVIATLRKTCRHFAAIDVDATLPSTPAQVHEVFTDFDWNWLTIIALVKRVNETLLPVQDMAAAIVHAACRAGKFKTARRVDALHKPTISVDVWSECCEWAIRTNNPANVAWCIDNGAKNAFTVLSTAAKEGRLEIVRWGIANRHITPDRALIKACRYGQEDIVRLAIREGGYISPDAIRSVAYRGYLRLVKLLISKRPKCVKRWSKFLVHCWFAAAEGGQLHVLRWIAARYCMNFGCEFSCTPPPRSPKVARWLKVHSGEPTAAGFIRRWYPAARRQSYKRPLH